MTNTIDNLDAFTFARVNDPVAQLGQQRRIAYAKADHLVVAEDALFGAGASAADEEAANQAVCAAWDEVQAIERDMIGRIATTPAGIAEQAEVLRDFLSGGQYEGLVDNIIAGLQRIEATPAPVPPAAPALSPADQQLLCLVVGGMWCAGRTAQLTTMVVSLPPALMPDFEALIDRLAPNVEPIERDDAMEDAEAELLLQSVRHHDRIKGAVQGIAAVDDLRRRKPRP